MPGLRSEMLHDTHTVTFVCFLSKIEVNTKRTVVAMAYLKQYKPYHKLFIFASDI